MSGAAFLALSLQRGVWETQLKVKRSRPIIQSLSADVVNLDKKCTHRVTIKDPNDLPDHIQKIKSGMPWAISNWDSIFNESIKWQFQMKMEVDIEKNSGVIKKKNNREGRRGEALWIVL